MVKCIISLFVCQSISTQSAPTRSIHQHKSSLCLSVLFLVLYTLANPIQAATVPGYTPGELSISPGGAANYSIPIAVPPGVAGMQPSLSLNYNSQGGNGLLGVGWSLGGLSAISRCPATIVQDGFKGGIKFDANDRFCMDGQRLIAISGTVGADGAEYRTEIDGFSKIISYGQAGSGPAYWKVWTKSGQVLEYGVTENSRIEAQGKSDITIWAVNKILDAVGNSLSVSYSENNSASGEFYPQQIDYAGNYIQFNYELRPDTTSRYSGGSRIQSTQRLTNIKNYANGNVVRDYQIAYEDSPSISRLKDVTECNGNSPQDCLPATNINWQEINEAFSMLSVDTKYGMQTDWWYDSNRKLRVFDYNGDGKNDFILQGVSAGKGTFLMTATSNGFSVQGISNSYGLSENDWVASNRVLHILDYNGDGRSDLLLQGSNSGKGTYLLTATDSGFNVQGVSTSYGMSENDWVASNRVLHIFDYNGDGLSDILLQGTDISKGTFLLTSTGAGFSLDGVTSSYNMDANNWAADRRKLHIVDHNGDGLSDILLQGADINKGTFLLTSTGTSFSLDGITNSYNMDANNWAADRRVLHVLDHNGDGLTDILLQGVDINKGTFLLTSTGAGFSLDGITNSYNMDANNWAADRRVLRTLDYNGDGLSDIILQGANTGKGTFLLTSTGTGFNLDGVSNINGLHEDDWIADRRVLHVMDYDGDGYVELLLQAKTTGRSSYLLTFGKTVKPRVDAITDGLGNQTQLTFKPLTDATIYTKGTTANNPEELDLQAPMYVVSQVDTDNGQGGTNSTTYKYGGLKAHVKGRGLLGFAWMESTNLHTKIITHTDYIQDFPFIGQVASTEQHYIEIDETTNTIITDILLGRTEMNTVGVYKCLVDDCLPGGTYTNLSELTLADLKTLNKQPGEVYFSYVSKSVDEKYDFDSEALVTTSITENSYDAYGNPTEITVSTLGAPWNETKTTVNEYDNNVDNNTWHLGRLKCAVVKHSNNNLDAPDITRASSFTYNTDGLLESETIAPNTAALSGQCITALGGNYIPEPDLTLTTTYGYDDFGRKNLVTVSGYNGEEQESRITKINYDVVNDLDRVVTEVFAGLVEGVEKWHKEERYYDKGFGVLTKLIGPNGLETKWEYDAFGRKEKELRADDTETTITRHMCNPSCPADAPDNTKLYTITQSKTASGVTVSPAVTVYSDKLGRKLRTHTIGFNGNAAYQDTEYNDLSQVKRTSHKYFANDPIYWTRYVYDDIGRVIEEYKPLDLDGTPGPDTETAVTLREYKYFPGDGSGVVETNSEGQKTTRITDQQGKLYKVKDNAGKTTTYLHTPTGNLVKTTDPLDNEVVMEYNIRGWKKNMNDPDMGLWEYKYNAFGELVGQTDAKHEGQTEPPISMKYDLLGRMYERTEPEAVTTWVYDEADANNKGVGKLSRVEIAPIDQIPGNGVIDGPYGSGYTRKHYYDDKGRPKKVESTIVGQTFTQETGYEAGTSRVEYTRTIPADSNAQTVTVTNTYNSHGYLWKKHSAEILATRPIWEVTGVDANGNAVVSTMSTTATEDSVLTTTRAFNAASGYLEIIQTGIDNEVQFLDYTYDTIGNLTQRQDLRAGVTEDFSYAEGGSTNPLNRLTGVTVTNDNQNAYNTGSRTYAYNEIGNIINKSDFGEADYGYSGINAGPHAVTSANGSTYLYDANGNMTDGGGRHIDWTSFNKPLEIQLNSSSVQSVFFYDADHNRVQQVSVNSSGEETTTTYLGKSYERVEKPTYTEHKHHINVPGATILYTDRPTGTSDTRYLHKDHLGSITAITREDGSIEEQMSFDAWGARRNVDTNNALNKLISSVTTRGFTGHEQLDGVGLVHMNGRVYDPMLGRFLSADLQIQFPANLQSFNRYSYVHNNPLSFTDPSGYGLWKKIKRGAKKLYKSAKKLLKSAVKMAIVPSFKNINSFMKYSGDPGYHIMYSKPVKNLFLKNEWARVTGQMAASYFGGAWGSAAFSAYMTDISGGSMMDVYRSAAMSYVTAAASSNVGAYDVTASLAGRVVAHGVVGGALSQANGGKFADGFKMAFITASAKYLYSDISSRIYNKTGEPHLWLKGKADVGIQLESMGLTSEEFAKIVNGTMKAPFSSDQSDFMQTVAKGPFMDAFAEFHDGLHDLNYIPNDQISLIVTMPPSYAITVAAAAQPYTHLYLMERNKQRK